MPISSFLERYLFALCKNLRTNFRFVDSIRQIPRKRYDKRQKRSSARKGDETGDWIYNSGIVARRATTRSDLPPLFDCERATPSVKHATPCVCVCVCVCVCTRVPPKRPMSRRLAAMGAFQRIWIKFHSSWTNQSALPGKLDAANVFLCTLVTAMMRTHDRGAPFSLQSPPTILITKKPHQKYNLARTSVIEIPVSDLSNSLASCMLNKRYHLRVSLS